MAGASSVRLIATGGRTRRAGPPATMSTNRVRHDGAEVLAALPAGGDGATGAASPPGATVVAKSRPLRYACRAGMAETARRRGGVTAAVVADPVRSRLDHRPRERGATLTTSSCDPRARRSRARDQWLMWPGVLPRSPRYLPRAMLATRQIGSRGTDSTSRPRPTRASSAARPQDRRRARAPRSPARGRMHRRERQADDVGEDAGESTPPPPGGERVVVEVDAHDVRLGVERPQLGADLALAHPDLEDGRGAPRGSASQRGEETLHQPSLDGVPRGVLVVGVARRDARGHV